MPEVNTDVVYHGDCIDLMKGMPDASIDLIFADPPYNLSGNGMEWKGNRTGGDWNMVNEPWDKMPEKDYLEFTTMWIGESARLMKRTSSIYVSCTHHNIGEVIMSMKRAGLKINNIITWYKVNAMPNMTRRVFTHSTEFVIWGVKGKGWVFNYEDLKRLNPEKRTDGRDKQMPDLWAIPLVQGKERLYGDNGKSAHPTQKPMELLKRIMTASSKVGDVVLDPFAGSGTTLVTAMKMNRKYIGIEKSGEYIELIRKRLDSI